VFVVETGGGLVWVKMMVGEVERKAWLEYSSCEENGWLHQDPWERWT
jgi:hypothetical protein